MRDKEDGPAQDRPETIFQGRENKPIWCHGCETDDHIFIERARRPPWAPEGTMDVVYFCSQCRTLHGNLITESELQDKFIAAVETARRS